LAQVLIWKALITSATLAISHHDADDENGHDGSENDAAQRYQKFDGRPSPMRLNTGAPDQGNQEA